MSLYMKYFILKPKSKGPDDQYAHASREAMKAYADAIESTDLDLSQSLRQWRRTELKLANKPLHVDQKSGAASGK